MTPLEKITSFTELLAEYELDIYANEDHECLYRTMVGHMLKIVTTEMATTFMTRTSTFSPSVY